MKDRNKTKTQLLEEVEELRTTIDELKALTAKRKQPVETIEEREEWYRQLFENANDAIYLLDPQTTMIIDCNNKAAEMDGYTVDELKEMRAFDLHPEDEQQILPERFRTVSEKGSVSNITGFHHVRKDGRPIPIEVNATMIKIGGKVFNLSIVRDVTERKQAEEDLKSERDKLQALMEGLARTEIGIDVVGIDYRVLFQNRILKEKFGDLMGELCYKKYMGLKRPCDFCPMVKAIQSRKVENVELTGVDGRSYELLSAPLLNPDGTVDKAIEVVKDITERKKAERELKEYSKKLEEMVEKRTEELKDTQEQLIRKEKLAILGQLAGGVGHELRNPLGVINNAAYYLKTILADADETTREYLDIISTEVDNSEKIVSDLLDFSRIKSVDKEHISISDLITEALGEKPVPENIKVKQKIDSRSPRIFIDPRQIGQVLNNLVTNAYQAMPDGGELTITTHKEKDTAVLTVADTGVGISDENLKKIFEPLFTTKAKGIGLGLAVSKNLVEANGGEIKVESEEGKGSTFTLMLPMR